MLVKSIFRIIIILCGIFILHTTPASGYSDPYKPAINMVAQRMGYTIEIIRITWDAPETSDETDTAKLTGYNIYRRAYLTLPGGPDLHEDDTTGFEYIGSTTADVLEFTDRNIHFDSLNCFIYYVKAVYADKLSEHSNVDWDCVFDFGKIATNDDLLIAPNPVESVVRFSISEGINNLKIFTSNGKLIYEKELTGDREYTCYLNKYKRGIYNVIITTPKGNTLHKMFLKF